MKDKNKNNQDNPKVNVELDDQDIKINIDSNDGEVAALKQEVEDLKKQTAELNDLLKIQIANERNSLRRRDEIEKDLRKYSAKELAQLIIPEVELLKQVLASLANHENKELKNYLMGFEMVIKKIDNDLEEVGIKQIPLKVGDAFDEKYQEAIEQVPTTDFKQDSVVEIVNNGYMIHDRVLIHARVKIAGSNEPEKITKDNEGDK